VDLMTDPLHCRTCDHACPGQAYSSPFCTAGVCGAACVPGRGDCDGEASNGCEALLDTVVNCHGCGVACAYPHAAADCGPGGCTMGSCHAGRADCNGSAVDGCETELTTDRAHCGACGEACGSGQVCASGACVASCGVGLVSCGGACVDLANDPAHCRACDVTCPTVAHATAVCAAGRCGFVCHDTHADCDREASNGCEVDLSASAVHCGRCDRACRAGEACAAGSCVVPGA
jgi:hypothetical protein